MNPARDCRDLLSIMFLLPAVVLFLLGVEKLKSSEFIVLFDTNVPLCVLFIVGGIVLATPPCFLSKPTQS